MRLSAVCLTLLSASSLAACSATGGASDGAGYELLTPASETRTFIAEHDKEFRDQVAEHNLQCGKDPFCQK